MIIENLPILNINKLLQKQYEHELATINKSIQAVASAIEQIAHLFK